MQDQKSIITPKITENIQDRVKITTESIAIKRYYALKSLLKKERDQEIMTVRTMLDGDFERGLGKKMRQSPMLAARLIRWC